MKAQKEDITEGRWHLQRAIKVWRTSTAQGLHVINIYPHSQIPNERRTSILIPLFKKSNKSDPNIVDLSFT